MFGKIEMVDHFAERKVSKFLVSTGGSLIRIWNVKDGVQIITLYGH